MKVRIEYTFDRENGIINRCFCGDIGLAENIDSWNQLFEEVDFNEVVGVITDFTEANLKMELDEISTILKFLDDNLENLRRIKLAVISLKPEAIVFPTLAHEDFPELQIQPFSTLDGAIQWILD